MPTDQQNTPASMALNPVGVVRSPFKTPMLMADDSGLSLELRMEKVKEHHRQVKTGISELVIDKQWESLLDGVEGFSHLLILYWPHLMNPARRNLKKVHPMGRKELPEQGIFATCSPARPNPVLVTAVVLKERKGNILTVQGLEAVDGSPIIDIKPYSQSYMIIDSLKSPDWMEQIRSELDED
ncbi:tRNA (N6-threonylcarbamoyladenosine(37)-N6)-methyltransferase TrmO [Desulfobacter curvatus]|uniref:tRNA (N6-threonylcarbamoyladenosine(37)-N6)-methyltransferase TrmO n=1 Tax=Desulfobacter curvatus TaxID=2290 RepID=UPI000379D557|nr:tRNA (N6-threonylcarbamoyladenosine(37)-N6)-methyltransferase TrmO [Desulfobacter curvatus]